MLSLLTPTQFAELFPKQWERALPDVGGFREAVSRKSQQKQADILEGLASGQATTIADAEKRGQTSRSGSTGSSGGGKISNPVMVRQIYDYLMTKPGMDHSHAIGIINNMQHESNFNSGFQ